MLAKQSSSVIRIFILTVVFCSLIFVLIVRLFCLQIMQDESYNTNTGKDTKKILVENAARGNIYDCNGKILATNRLSYNVTVTDTGSYKSDRERQLVLNSMIYKLRQTAVKYKIKFENGIQVEVGKDGKYHYTTDGTALLRFKADIFGQADPSDMTKEQKEASAEDCIKYLSGSARYCLYEQGKERYTKKSYVNMGCQKNLPKIKF